MCGYKLVAALLIGIAIIAATVGLFLTVTTLTIAVLKVLIPLLILFAIIGYLAEK